MVEQSIIDTIKLLFKNQNHFYFQSIVWQGFAELLYQEPNELPVVFKNVEFLRKTVIPEQGKEIEISNFRLSTIK